MADTEILLESGTNEIEIMQFTIYGELYGINVAKVREIMMANKVKPIPHSHEAVEGIFKPRDILLTVIDLPKYLTGKESERNARDLFIITNFNKTHIAFRVHSVVGISRISWEHIQKPDKTITYGEEGVATGIILAEDSILLARMIKEALAKAGYDNILVFNNGKEAWDYLQSVREDQDFEKKVSLIITDIEMPEMDGHRLTKLVKEDQIMKDTPLIIFSSLINPEMRIKGKSLGADEQLSKPEIGHLVEVMDTLLERRGQ